MSASINSDNYQHFAEEQLGNWRQIDALIEKLNHTEGLNAREVIEEISKLKKTTELSMYRAERNLQDLQQISRPGPRASSEIGEKRKPIKPASPDQQTNPQLRSEIDRIRADSLRNDDRIGLGSHRSVPEDSGNGAKSQLTPSQSSIHIARKTNEVWAEPKPEKIEEQKAAFAKALMNDKEPKNKWNDFKLNSLVNSLDNIQNLDYNHNPLYSPTGRTASDYGGKIIFGQKKPPQNHHVFDGYEPGKRQKSPQRAQDKEDHDCNVIIEDNQKSNERLCEEQAVVELNSARGELGSTEYKRSTGSLFEDRNEMQLTLGTGEDRGISDAHIFTEPRPDSIAFKNIIAQHQQEKKQLALNVQAKGEFNRTQESFEKELTDPVADGAEVPFSNPLNEYLDPTSYSWTEMAKMTSMIPLPENAALNGDKSGVIAIENGEDQKPNLTKNVFLNNKTEGKGMNRRLSENSKQAREIQTDIVTAEVLNMLFEELMMDGLVLRELFKLQVDMPKGIKTNIRAIKKYLARLCEYINSRTR